MNCHLVNSEKIQTHNTLYSLNKKHTLTLYYLHSKRINIPALIFDMLL